MKLSLSGNTPREPGRLHLLFILLLVAVLPLLVSPPLMAEETTGSAMTGDQADAIFKELKAIRVLLEKIDKQGAKRPSKPTTAKVSIKGQPAMGEPDAPVTVVEFSDYQCPFCLRFTSKTFPHLKKKYIDTGKVRWVAFNLPMSFHPHARKAAQAAMCANDQGKFWEMRALLFNNQKQLGMEFLSGYARELSLDISAFQACLNSDRHLTAIDKEAGAANAVRLTGTPSFIVGKTVSDEVSGRVIIGAQPLNAFDDAIQQALKQKPVDQEPAGNKPSAG